jgi:hypothetical protein
MLSELAEKVYIFQNLDFLTGERRLQELVGQKENITVITGVTVSALLGEAQFEGVSLRNEKTSVIRYGETRFRRRSAAVGSAMSGLFMIPILAYLVINIYTGSSLGVFFVVLASMLVAASLVIVPLMVPEDRAFWTFCAFCASLMLLLAVTCLYSHGRWFWIASSATLFGLGLIFLPFLIKARPVRKLIGDSNPVMVVLGTDAILFINMMNMITRRGKITSGSILFTIGIIAGIVVITSEILRKRREKNEK